MERSFIFNGGQSKRFHTVETIKPQNIADHSFGVAWFCELLTGGRARKPLIMAALAHDLAEHMTGDIPSPAKRAMGLGEKFHNHEMELIKKAGLGHYFMELTSGEELTLKLADMLDGCQFCIRERRMGNLNVEIVFGRFYSYATDIFTTKKVEAETSFTYDEATAENIIRDIYAEWKEINDV